MEKLDKQWKVLKQVQLNVTTNKVSVNSGMYNDGI